MLSVLRTKSAARHSTEPARAARVRVRAQATLAPTPWCAAPTARTIPPCVPWVTSKPLCYLMDI